MQMFVNLEVGVNPEIPDLKVYFRFFFLCAAALAM